MRAYKLQRRGCVFLEGPPPRRKKRKRKRKNKKDDIVPFGVPSIKTNQKGVSPKTKRKKTHIHTHNNTHTSTWKLPMFWQPSVWQCPVSPMAFRQPRARRGCQWLQRHYHGPAGSLNIETSPTPKPWGEGREGREGKEGREGGALLVGVSFGDGDPIER